jgi:hypothetical protein
MRNLDGKILFAAHDLDRFLACSHATFLDIRNLQGPLPKSGEDAQLRLVREKGFEHEKAWLDAQKRKGISIAEIPEQAPPQERARATLEAMNSGADIIYQAALIPGNWHGYADFLRRTEIPGCNIGAPQIFFKSLNSGLECHRIQHWGKVSLGGIHNTSDQKLCRILE